MHTLDILIFSLNQDLTLNGFKYFQLPFRNNAEGAYNFSHPSAFYIC